uniref:Uncharacterized protein n=1 Tax=Octactis speculum TaxID=3111310 RepID=A0A7S2FQ37_9STRA|mmetsp:Transcript_26362/g.36244  ORF Transcript_26362/g.36244 Transcript_26362/m.36244 type:complete len:106 (+) Transcript_26362:34-351(+)
MSVESDGASYKTRVTCFFYVSKAPINVLKTQAVATILLKASGGVLGYEVFEGYANDAGELDYDIKTRREPIWLEAVGTVILGHPVDWHRYVKKNESDLEFEVRNI